LVAGSIGEALLLGEEEPWPHGPTTINPENYALYGGRLAEQKDRPKAVSEFCVLD